MNDPHPQGWTKSCFTNKFDYLYVEPTTYCSLKCERCDRTSDPNSYKLTHLTPHSLGTFLKSKKWANLETIEYGGNLGDPLMHDQLDKLIQAAREIQPQASHLIHTSGANRNRIWWENLMKYLTPKDSITFSVDGLRDTNHLYRVNAKWETIEDAMNVCIGKIHTHWKMIVFRHNEHQIREVVRRAKDIGVEWFLLTKSSLFNPGLDRLKPSPQWISNPKKNTSSKVEPKCVSSSRHFLAADGRYYPCCWIAVAKQPSVDCLVTDEFNFEEILHEPVQTFAKTWTSNPHSTCLKNCGNLDFETSSRTQYNQIEINLSEPFNIIENILEEFSKKA
jgi:hypothetical protein